MIIDLENIICQDCNTCLFKEKSFFNYMTCSCNSVRYYKNENSINVDLNEDRISIDLKFTDSIAISSTNNSLNMLLRKLFSGNRIEDFESLSNLYFVVIKTYINLITYDNLIFI